MGEPTIPGTSQPLPAGAATPTFHRRIAGFQAEIPPLCDEIEHWADPLGVPAGTVQAVGLMLDELITNVITHGFKGGPAQEIDVTLRCLPGSLEVLVRDTAPAFDPLTIPAADTESDVASRPIGGLGIHLVRRLSDALAYRRDGDVNEVSLRKAFTPAPRAGSSP